MPLLLLVATVVEHISRCRRSELGKLERGIINEKLQGHHHIPEWPAAHAVQEARGEGSSLAVGIKRALDAIIRERHVKGRRISTVKLFVKFEQPEEELP